MYIPPAVDLTLTVGLEALVDGDLECLDDVELVPISPATAIQSVAELEFRTVQFLYSAHLQPHRQIM